MKILLVKPNLYTSANSMSCSSAATRWEVINMPVNPNDAPEGYYAVKSMDGECDGCAFNTQPKWCLGKRCWASDRNDKTAVIFKKIDHGFRIDNLGAACG
jgi:hypothetical protein